MSNNERILKEDHILQCQQAFTQFDSNNSGLVATKDLGNLLRALGINPTNEELQVIIEIFVVNYFTFIYPGSSYNDISFKQFTKGFKYPCHLKTFSETSVV